MVRNILRESRYGSIGGQGMSILTGRVDPNQWLKDFVILTGFTDQYTVGLEAEKFPIPEVKKYYDDNAAKFQGNEQRRASHILIAFGVSATPEQKQQAKVRAEEILAQIKKDPSKFEQLALKNSQDPGSAVKGGDLGSFGHGAMVKPFEDAAFSMNVNQVSD